MHRGVYVAAEILYERFKPMVEEQLASSPFAKVAFTVRPSELPSLSKHIACHKHKCLHWVQAEEPFDIFCWFP